MKEVSMRVGISPKIWNRVKPRGHKNKDSCIIASFSEVCGVSENIEEQRMTYRWDKQNGFYRRSRHALFILCSTSCQS